MKPQWVAWSRKYRIALEERLWQTPAATSQAAHGLGQQAMMLGLEIPDMARIHKTALAALMPRHGSSSRKHLAKHAQEFFHETTLPIEKKHRAEMKSSARSHLQQTTLTERIAHLAATNHRLKKGIHARKTAEEVLRKNGKHRAKLLREANLLQKQLRHLAHQLLLTQEAERKMISHELHDRIAQTLLGINVRLMTLKKTAEGDPTMLTKEIASTQRVVKESVKSINRFAHELDIHQAA